MSSILGKSIGRYHILEQLGQGGMSNVYKAFDTRLEREVAVKVIRTELFGEAFIERVLKRFEREAKALARLDHPNIIKVYEFGEYENAPYLVMQYIRSGTLKDIIGQPMPYQDAVRLLLPIAKALAYAHENGVLHRDVKPSNILITENNVPVLTDFGIAKLLEGEEGQTLTGTGLGIGTPEYMAPEQGLGKEVDTRADIYSLGIVFYELITGQKPYTADTPMAVIIKQIHDPLPRLKDFLPELPDEVEKVFLKVMAKEPECRYQSMEEFSKALLSLSSRVSLSDDKQQGKRTFTNIVEIIKKDDDDTHDEINTSIEERRQLISEGSIRKITNRKITNEELRSKLLIEKTFIWLWIGMGGIIIGLGIILFGGNIIGQSQVSLNAKDTLTPDESSIETVTITITSLPEEMMTFTSTLSPTVTEIPTITLIPTITPTPGIGSKRISEVDEMVQVYVPEGSFSMGSDFGTDNEKPVHSVYLDAYWIDQTEVTNKMYKKCVEDGECVPVYNAGSHTRDVYYGNSKFDDYPVLYVNWYYAQAYCEWAGRELPTEAQWEKAARGTDERTYPWGEGISCEKANYNACEEDTVKAGSLVSGISPYGAYDMAGNVGEWVSDWYDSEYYKKITTNNENSEEIVFSVGKVFRGGAWADSSFELRSANRDVYRPDLSFSLIGFRCVSSE